jgi:hypothetical protein
MKLGRAKESDDLKGRARRKLWRNRHFWEMPSGEKVRIDYYDARVSSVSIVIGAQRSRVLLGDVSDEEILSNESLVACWTA